MKFADIALITLQHIKNQELKPVKMVELMTQFSAINEVDFDCKFVAASCSTTAPANEDDEEEEEHEDKLTQNLLNEAKVHYQSIWLNVLSSIT